jgi:hypothetical protein
VPVRWAGDEKLKEPIDADLRVQAERVAKTFACSFHEGSRATFYFLLPHYVEGPTQFGIVRPDLTPRPAFVALAAVGRLLADARPLGRLRTADAGVRAFAFRARPDGEAAEVLVAWSTNGSGRLRLPVVPARSFDYLGRPVAVAGDLPLRTAPIFALLPLGGSRKLALEPSPAPPRKLKRVPSSVVLQAPAADGQSDLSLSARRVTGAAKIPIFAYNFGAEPVRGTLRLDAPPEWKLDAPKILHLNPMERRELFLTGSLMGPGPIPLRVTGEFGRAGEPVLSVRVVAASGK